VLLNFDLSWWYENELCSSDKSVSWKHNEYDLGRAWSHFDIPFFRDPKLISAPFDFSVDERSECTSSSFVRASSNIYTFSELLLSLVTARVNLHSIENGIGFHSFSTHKSESKIWAISGSYFVRARTQITLAGISGIYFCNPRKSLISESRSTTSSFLILLNSPILTFLLRVYL